MKVNGALKPFATLHLRRFLNEILNAVIPRLIFNGGFNNLKSGIEIP
jgi:hypothetical protein